MRHPTQWPAEVHPLIPASVLPPVLGPDAPVIPPGTLVPDTTTTAHAYQLRADLITEFTEWTGGTIAARAGRLVVELPDGTAATLGDYAVKANGTGPARVQPAAGFWLGWCPADST